MNDREIGKRFIEARKNFRNNPYYINPNQETEVKLPKRFKINKKDTTGVKIRKSIANVLLALSEKEKLLKGIEKNFGLILGATILATVSSIKFKESKTIGYGEGYEDTFSGKSTGKLSSKGKDFIIRKEGLRTKAYRDSKGFLTIGVGHRGKVDGKDITEGMVITETKARELFDSDIKKFEDYVNKVVKVPVSQNMFDAMVSYSFNVGSLGPKFLQKINSGNYQGAMQELNTVDPELQTRRREEREMFGKDISATGALNIPSNKVQVGSKIKGYSIGKNVKMSAPVKQVLEEAGGKGYISSVIRENAPHTSSSHWSGNKFDLGLGGLTMEKVIEEVAPIMNHPAVVQVGFECFGSKGNTSESNRITRNIESKIKEKYPNIAKRISEGSLKVQHWGWSTGGTGPHLDVLINPNKLNLAANKNNLIAVNNVKQKTKPILEQVDEEDDIISSTKVALNPQEVKLSIPSISKENDYITAYQKGWRNDYNTFS